MKEYKFTITVKTDKEYSLEDCLIIAQDFSNRLSGFTTKTPEQLNGVSMTLYIPKKIGFQIKK